MNPVISEFSYGYAITEELATGYGSPLCGAPIFPSLIEEGTVGGYDLELPVIGAPIFLQFKLAHYLKRSSALEWAHWNAPYYRMYLRPLRHSQQHNLLLSWENQGNEVYYASPMFHEAAELNAAYTGRQVVQSSVFFRPQDIGALPDDAQHYVIFHPSDPVAYRYSKDPLKIRSQHGSHWMESVFWNAKEKMTDINVNMLRQLLIEMEHTLAEFIPAWELKRRVLYDRFARKEPKGIAAHLSYLARTYLDAQFILISPRKTADQSEQEN